MICWVLLRVSDEKEGGEKPLAVPDKVTEVESAFVDLGENKEIMDVKKSKEIRFINRFLLFLNWEKSFFDGNRMNFLMPSYRFKMRDT